MHVELNATIQESENQNEKGQKIRKTRKSGKFGNLEKHANVEHSGNMGKLEIAKKTTCKIQNFRKYSDNQRMQLTFYKFCLVGRMLH